MSSSSPSSSDGSSESAGIDSSEAEIDPQEAQFLRYQELLSQLVVLRGLQDHQLVIMMHAIDGPEPVLGFEPEVIEVAVRERFGSSRMQ